VYGSYFLQFLAGVAAAASQQLPVLLTVTQNKHTHTVLNVELV